jgi:small-conductance mechanosensitive channel
MDRSPSRFRLVLLTLLLCTVPFVANAQVIDERRITNLYDVYLESDSQDQLTLKKIDAEREKVRGIIQQELSETIAGLTRAGSGTTLAQTVERQRQLVSTLEAQRDETEIDLDLLEEEEQYYIGPQAGSGSTEGHVTASHAELLAKRLILEERAKAMDIVIANQQERLRKLGVQQRFDQFLAFAGIGKYLLLILVFILAERFIRVTFLARIANRNRRYTVMKVFTAAAYILMLAVLIIQLSTDHPGFITSFAIIGAGVAIALQDIIKGLFGWLLIVQKRMFGLGQRITVGPYSGDVIDISPLRTTILEVHRELGGIDHDTSRIGQTLYLPNSYFLREPVLNYHSTSDFIEAEIRIIVSPKSSWQDAERILKEILHEETDPFTERARRQTVSRTQHFFVSQDARGARVFMEVSGRGILFTLRFLVPIGERRLIISKITGIILERFSKASPPVEIAYEG